MQNTRKEMGIYAIRGIASVLCLLAVLAHNLPLGLTIGRTEALYLGILCLLTLLLPAPATTIEPIPPHDDEGTDARKAKKAYSDVETNRNWTGSHTVTVLLAAYGIVVIVLCALFIKNPDRITLYLLLIAALPWIRIPLKILGEGGASAMRAYGVLFTLVCATGIISRIAFPAWTIDSISVILLALMAVPLLLPRLKSLEMSGIGKVELITENQAKSMLSQIDSDTTSSKEPCAIMSNDPDLAYQQYRTTDVRLTLSGLRFALERNLRKLYYQKNKIDPGFADATISLDEIMDSLGKNAVFSTGTMNVIKETFRLLDKGIQTRRSAIESTQFNSIVEMGTHLLCAIKERLEPAKA